MRTCESSSATSSLEGLSRRGAERAIRGLGIAPQGQRALMSRMRRVQCLNTAMRDVPMAAVQSEVLRDRREADLAKSCPKPGRPQADFSRRNRPINDIQEVIGAKCQRLDLEFLYVGSRNAHCPGAGSFIATPLGDGAIRSRTMAMLSA